MVRRDRLGEIGRQQRLRHRLECSEQFAQGLNTDRFLQHAAHVQAAFPAELLCRFQDFAIFTAGEHYMCGAFVGRELAQQLDAINTWHLQVHDDDSRRHDRTALAKVRGSSVTATSNPEPSAALLMRRTIPGSSSTTNNRLLKMSSATALALADSVH